MDAAVGHGFRGEFLDRFAKIEEWACSITQDAKIGQDKAQHPLRNKLKDIRAFAESDKKLAGESILKSPPILIKLIDDAAPYLDMRTTLAHATQVLARSSGGERLFIYKPVGSSGCRFWPMALTASDQERALAGLADIAKRFEDQRLR